MARQNTPGLKISEMKMQDQVRKLQRRPQLRDWENGPVTVVRVQEEEEEEERLYLLRIARDSAQTLINLWSS